MTAIYLLLPLSLLVALGFLAAFIWAVRSGQYEDTCTPAMRALMDDPPKPGSPADSALQEPNTQPTTHERRNI
jgi:cbb3-type cytochrome oxidase maturation protein